MPFQEPSIVNVVSSNLDSCLSLLKPDLSLADGSLGAGGITLEPSIPFSHTTTSTPDSNNTVAIETGIPYLDELLQEQSGRDVLQEPDLPSANTILSNFDQNDMLSKLQSPEAILSEPCVILLFAVLCEMLLPIPNRFKFSGLQTIFNRLAHRVNLPDSSRSQKVFAGFFLPLILLLFCLLIVLFLDLFTHGDAIIFFVIMLYLLELHLPQATAKKISEFLQYNQKEKARAELDSFVLREVNKLSSMGIAKAACEGTILRISHGWFAVMVWYFIGGVEGAVIMQSIVVMSRAFNYKLPNNYMFGQLVFIILEMMLFIPALALGFMLMFSKNPLKPWICGFEGISKYPSPVTGFILGAVGGALNISLGGPRYYFGRLYRLQKLGGTNEPDAMSVLHAMRKMRMSGWIMLIIAVLISL